MHEEESFLDRYLHLLTDPAHWMFELTVMIVVDLIIIGIGWRLVKKWINRHDKEVHGHGSV